MFNRDFNGAVKEISAKEFHSTGLLLVINNILHLFGFAIVYDTENDRLYPAMCKFRGFDEKSIDRSTKKIYAYLDENLDNIRKDVDY